MSKATPARRAALSVLERAEKRGAYVRELLDASDAVRALDARDASFAVRLALGTTAAAGTLDELLDRFVAKPRSVAPSVRLALRMAAFEIIYLNTPSAAAVSQGVELVRSRARSAAGLANAVLRKVAAHADAYLRADDAPENDRELVASARRAGLPVWLARRMRAGFEAAGAGAEEKFAQTCDAALEPAPVYVHASGALGPDAFERRAAGEGLALAGPPAPLAGAYALVSPRALAGSRLAREQALAVSDFAAQVVAAAAARPGTVLELGSGRGTKTYVIEALLRQLGRGATRAGGLRHVAVDLYEGKARLNRERLERAGLAAGVACVAADAADLLGEAGRTVLLGSDTLAGRCARGFDTVLLDAPCSGTGTMRRHPEIPWRLAPADVDPAQPNSLPALQRALLGEAARCVAFGGTLIYATCSVLREENEDVLGEFLASREGARFSVVPFADALSQAGADDALAAWARARQTPQGFLRTYPAPGSCDGHFAAALVKRA